MALPATDNFTGVDGTQLTTYSANWTLNNGDFDIQSNALACDANDECGAHWNADVFSNDQYSEVDLTGFATSGLWVGVCVRAAASGATYYGYYGSGDDSYLFKMVSGTWTEIASGGAVASGDTLRLEAQGTTLTPTQNGSTTGTPGAQTDSAIASGSSGVAGYADADDLRMDDWEGGNIGGGGISIPVVMHHLRQQGIS